MSASYFEFVLIGFILLLPFLYEFSQPFRCYSKFFIYYSGTIFMSIVLMPVLALRPKDVKNLVIASFFCKRISPIIGIKWVLRGEGYLRKDEACIIVSNHQSSLDILGMFDIWHIMGKCTVVAKKQLFYIWPFGISAWLSGLIFIDRTHSNKAQEIVNNAAEIVKKNKCKLWVFVEGTRRNTGEIHSFKKGAFHMAISAQIPILPVVYSQYYFLSTKEKRFDSGKVIITTLPPIPTIGMTSNDIEKLLEMTREKMITTFTETTREVLSSEVMEASH